MVHAVRARGSVSRQGVLLLIVTGVSTVIFLSSHLLKGGWSITSAVGVSVVIIMPMLAVQTLLLGACVRVILGMLSWRTGRRAPH